MHASTRSRARRRPLALSIALTAGVLWIIGPGAGSAFAAAPVCVNSSHTVDNTATLHFPGTANCSDADNDPMQASLNSNVTHGSLTPDGSGGAIYDPNPGYVGPDSFTYHVVAGGEDSNVATVSITVTGTPGTQPPSCFAPPLTAFEGQTQTFSLFCFDLDTPANQLTVTDLTQGTHGLATFSGITGSYAADDEYIGPDSFSLKVSDGTNTTATLTVNVNVIDFPEGNEPPTCPESHAFVEKNDPVGIRLTGNCVDPDLDPVSYAPGSPFVDLGSVCCFQNGNSVLYFPPSNGYVGEDTLRYSAADAYHPPVHFEVQISILEDITVCCETAPEATPADPYAASINSPVEGPIYIDTRALTDSFPAPTGFSFLAQEYDITTPDAVDPDDPLTFLFKLDAAELAAANLDPEDVVIFRNGEPIDDPCPPVGSRSGGWWPCEDDRDVVDGDLWVTVLTMESSVYNVGVADVQDADEDGVPDGDDNCPGDANPDQTDADEDGFGAACDTQEVPVFRSDCKDARWRDFNGIYGFATQGDCVSFVATGGSNGPK
jgi:hypothetical protein